MQSRVSTILLLGVLFTACGKDDDKTSETSFVISDDHDALQERLTQTNQEIELVDPATGLVGLLPGIETFAAIQVGELLPPTVSGSTLQANDVIVDGFGTYIAYNVAGSATLGAIDLLDITQILSLQILTSVSSTTSEYYGLSKEGNTLYAVGASDTSATGAFLSKIALSNGLITATKTQYDLPSYAGTDVLVTSDRVIAVSGDNGGLRLFTKATMAVESTVSIADARSVDVMADGSFMALSGQPGKASVVSTAGAITRTMSLGGATAAGAKSSLQVGSKWSLAALGAEGVTVFCNADGSVIANAKALPPGGTATSETVTNAASSSGGLIFTANGDAGVYVYSLKDGTTTGCGTGTLTFLGTLNFGNHFSANAVYYKNGMLFVVTGTGGLKILTATYVSTVALSNNL